MLIELTRDDGERILVNTDRIVIVRDITNELTGARSIIMSDCGQVICRESIREIMRRAEKGGAA